MLKSYVEIKFEISNVRKHFEAVSSIYINFTIFTKKLFRVIPKPFSIVSYKFQKLSRRMQ